MSQSELLKRVIAVLDANKIAYMVTGSYASSLQGFPRSTHDIDLVVNLRPSAAAILASAFAMPDYYLDADSIRQAVSDRTSFNLIDNRSGDKVDFWMLTDQPFDQQRFSRRVTENFEGLQIQVSAPEDTILMKLKWAADSGGSEKQFTDALNVFETQHKSLDAAYIESWAKKLDLLDSWTKLQQTANP